MDAVPCLISSKRPFVNMPPTSYCPAPDNYPLNTFSPNTKTTTSTTPRKRDDDHRNDVTTQQNVCHSTRIRPMPLSRVTADKRHESLDAKQEQCNFDKTSLTCSLADLLLIVRQKSMTCQ
mmetsp:Transcript_17653/g.29993  ORF Transcript_17653/g.29993 Transcript_17653/m.29993 type:complete len:120 (-) Transcript_17653:1109-1468(-)